MPMQITMTTMIAAIFRKMDFFFFGDPRTKSLGPDLISGHLRVIKGLCSYKSTVQEFCAGY